MTSRKLAWLATVLIAPVLFWLLATAPESLSEPTHTAFFIGSLPVVAVLGGCSSALFSVFPIQMLKGRERPSSIWVYALLGLLTAAAALAVSILLGLIGGIVGSFFLTFSGLLLVSVAANSLFTETGFSSETLYNLWVVASLLLAGVASGSAFALLTQRRRRG